MPDSLPTPAGRWILAGAVAAALVAIVAGVESTVEGGTAAVVRSCCPGLLLAAVAALALYAAAWASLLRGASGAAVPA